jgi:hypothetical protein
LRAGRIKEGGERGWRKGSHTEEAARTTFAGIAMAGWQHLEEVDHSSGTGRGRERGSAERRRIRTRAGEESAARPREVHSRSRSGCKVGHGGEGVESGPHRKESGAGGWRKGSHTEVARTTFAGIAMAGWWHLEEVDHSSGTGRGRGARQRGAEPEEPGRGKRAPREERGQQDQGRRGGRPEGSTPQEQEQMRGRPWGSS